MLAGIWLITAPWVAAIPVTPGAEPPPAAEDLWFEVGEEILYDIYWGMMNVGSSHVTTEWVSDESGRTLLRIRFESRSNKVLSSLYPVEDVQESLIDPETFLPVWFMKNSRQGRHRYHEAVRFDHAAGIAHWESFLNGKTKKVPIEPDTRDLISLMYWIRSQPAEAGASFETQVFTDEKIYDLQVNIPRREIVELKRYGRVASLLFEPEASFQGLFVRKGKVQLWVSEDARRLCTKIAARVPVASVRIQLAEVRGPGQDFWVGKAAEGSPESMPVRRAR